jgi:hypothetical protein
MPPGVRISFTAITNETARKGIRADRPAPRQVAVFPFFSERRRAIWLMRMMPAGPPAWFGSIRTSGSMFRVVDSLGDDKRPTRTDPVRAPPGAWTDLEVEGKIVIPTPIAVEIKNFQILRKNLHFTGTGFF